MGVVLLGALHRCGRLPAAVSALPMRNALQCGHREAHFPGEFCHVNACLPAWLQCLARRTCCTSTPVVPVCQRSTRLCCTHSMRRGRSWWGDGWLRWIWGGWGSLQVRTQGSCRGARRGHQHCRLMHKSALRSFRASVLAVSEALLLSVVLKRACRWPHMCQRLRCRQTVFSHHCLCPCSAMGDPRR